MRSINERLLESVEMLDRAVEHVERMYLNMYSTTEQSARLLQMGTLLRVARKCVALAHDLQPRLAKHCARNHSCPKCGDSESVWIALQCGFCARCGYAWNLQKNGERTT